MHSHIRDNESSLILAQIFMSGMCYCCVDTYAPMRLLGIAYSWLAWCSKCYGMCMGQQSISQNFYSNGIAIKTRNINISQNGTDKTALNVVILDLGDDDGFSKYARECVV